MEIINDAEIIDDDDKDIEEEPISRPTKTHTQQFANVFYSPFDFCRMIQLLSHEDALDDEALPSWCEKMQERLLKRNELSTDKNESESDLLRYIDNLEMKKYIKWVIDAEESEDGEWWCFNWTDFFSQF